MPFVNATSRKRPRSNSRAIWPFAPTEKIARVDPVFSDGAQSHTSKDSNSTGYLQKDNLREKLKRGGSNIKTLLGLANKRSESAPYCEEGAADIEKCGSDASFRNLRRSTATTVVQPLVLKLTGADFDGERDEVTELPNETQQRGDSPAAPFTPEVIPSVSHRRNRNSNQSLRKSQSHPGLTHRLSHKLQEAFGNPTIVHRSDLRTRPSIQSVNPFQSPLDVPEDPSGLPSSAPSTYKDSSSVSSPAGRQQSTPPTSGSLTLSPRSVSHQPGLSPAYISQTISFFGHDNSKQNRLSTISEATSNSIPSIVTVEAAASAKIFFETHFNAIFNSPEPRWSRRRDLEHTLGSLDVPSEVRYRIRNTWIRRESEHLRQERVLKTKANGSKDAKGVSIAGFEVVRVLGKGSFGVVRLVKEKHESDPKDEVVPLFQNSSSEIPKKPSRVDLASLKATAKEALAPLASRRRDLSKMKKEVYAMKVIRKSDMIKNSQEGHLRAERDFLVASAGSRWIIPLIASFQDSRNLYLVMDYCVGGDFLGLLIRKNTLSEDVTRWYVGEMILCVEEAHRLKWIHRDVKPDNFLIGADGHLKISDFGLAFDGDWAHDQQYFHKHRHSLVERLGISIEGDELDREESQYTKTAGRIGEIFSAPFGKSAKTEKVTTNDDGGPPEGESILDWHNREKRRKLARSVVGTSQYMAPEVIRGELYDGRCDWWSIGIIMYECLYGYTPFACENRQDTKLRILKHKTTLDFPEPPKGCVPISFDALDLMISILQEKEKRLSSRRYQLNDYALRMVNGSTVRVAADKLHRNYTGHFVYPDDAEEIKTHKFFRGVPWREMHLRKPPFVPRVKSWEDTKYFDEDDVVSDMSDSSDDDGGGEHEAHLAGSVVVKDVENAAGLRISHHHQQEGQKIVPSAGYPTKGGDTVEAGQLYFEPNPLRIPGILDSGSLYPPGAKAMGGGNLGLPDSNMEKTATENNKKLSTLAKKKREKEKKRPRDKILRDAECGKVALEMRKKTAFLGYGYRRAQGVKDVIDRALEDDRVNREVMGEEESKLKEAKLSLGRDLEMEVDVMGCESSVGLIGPTESVFI